MMRSKLRTRFDEQMADPPVDNLNPSDGPDHSSINEGNAMKKQANNPLNRKLSESDETASNPTGAVSGEFVTETFEYDGGRQVTVSFHRTRPKQSSSPVTVRESRSGAGCSKMQTHGPQ